MASVSQHDWKPRLSQQKKCSRSLLRVVSRNDACEVEQSSPIALSTFWLDGLLVYANLVAQGSNNPSRGAALQGRKAALRAWWRGFEPRHLPNPFELLSSGVGLVISKLTDVSSRI